MKNTLFLRPADCYAQHQTTAPVVAVKLGESGFYPIYTAATPEDLNDGAVAKDIVMSAVTGSMFGWDVPGAKKAVDYFKAMEAAEDEGAAA